MKAIGIDMTQSSKLCSLAVIEDGTGKVALKNINDICNDDALVQLCQGAEVVAMDSPLFLPLGLCCLKESCNCQSLSNKKGRECERLLSKRGISSYYTTKKTFIKPMIYRSIELARQISSIGTTVIEVYPYASGVALFGSGLPIKNKNRKAYCSSLTEKISKLVSGISLIKSLDQADAVLAAYTGLLWLRGEAEAIGSHDEGYIWLPLRFI